MNIFLLFFFIFLLSPLFPIPRAFSEVYSKELAAECNFDHDNQLSKNDCYKENIDLLHECASGPSPSNTTSITNQSPHVTEFVSNSTLARSEVSPTVNFSGSQSTVWKSKVEPLLMPRENFDNIAEPSIASNGTHVFYTGNYFAAKSKIGGDWKFVDPTFDFKGVFARGNVSSGNNTVSNSSEVNLFLADQRVIFDPHRNMFLWIRLGEPYAEGKVTNILRLAVSNDTTKWTVFDFVPIDTFKESDIIDATFDYPQVVLTKDFVYLTSTLIIGVECGKEYGTIFRIPLNDLSNSLNRLSNITYTAILDRNVTGIAPIDGSYNDTAYFGAHLKNTSSIKIIEWKEDSDSVSNQTVSIAPWNNIRNAEYCGLNSSDSKKIWWCEATTSSRIRSAWLYNDTLNFMWNAITTYDKGVTWKPYIDVATFDINNNMSYERKYHIADPIRPWIFGSAVSNIRGDLGVIAYYVTSNITDVNIHPYFNLAFGLFNHSSNVWDMTPLINSSHSLPVEDEKNKPDYNFGDFITIRQHPPDKKGYLWDIGGYVIVGKNYYDVEPYFIMIK